MKLFKHAYKEEDSILKKQLFKIFALKKVAEKKKRIIERTAQSRARLSDTQLDFWDLVEDYIRGAFWNRVKNYSDRTFAEDMVGEAILKTIEVLPEAWKKFDTDTKDGQKALVRYLINAGINEIRDKSSGSAVGTRGYGDYGKEDEPGYEYPTSYTTGVPKKTYHAVLPEVKQFIDKLLRDAGFSSPMMANDDQVQFIIQENFDEISDVYKAAEEKLLERGKTPPGLDKTLSRYRGHLSNKRGQEHQMPSSLDAPAYMGEESSGESASDLISGTNNLLGLFGINPFDVPEDAMIRKEIMNQILPLVYQIPIPYRMIMVVHYGIDTDILQQTNELDRAIEKAANRAGIDDTEEFLQAMKTGAGARLSWAATQRLLDAVYEKNVLKGIRNIDDFEDTVRDYFSDLIDEMS